MQIEFLGTGSSFGVPEIGCDCPVCSSDDPRDTRYRCSLLVRHEDVALVVDTPPEFRQQCLRAKLRRIDAVLLTHLHADHIFGLDDIRKFNRLQDMSVPVYLPEWQLERFAEVFRYALREPSPGLTRPRLTLHPIATEPMDFGDLHVQPLYMDHGSMDILGYLFQVGAQRCAYLTDCKRLPRESQALVRAADVIILGALWDRDWTHPGHLNLAEALEMGRDLEAKQLLLTHLTHYIGRHSALSSDLPSGVELAHDQLRVDVD